MKWNFYCLVLLNLLFCCVTDASACTNITVKAQDEAVIVGRSMEFGPDLQSHIMTSVKGKEITNTMPDGRQGKTWHAKYGYIYLDFFGIHHPVDGMNEAGLSFGYLYLPGYTKYQVVPQGENNNAVSYLKLGDWVLGNFSNIDEVKEAFKDIYIYEEPVTLQGNSTVFPLHVIITDASGKSLTVEFINGKTYVYDNREGTLTNAPTYVWQLNNLKNYINLTPYSPHPLNIDGVEYSGTGQGAGSIGLPGDFSPPSRFVKMSFLVQTANAVPDALSALNLAQHIINDVDIPEGAVRGEKGANTPIDKTQWTVFKDLKNRILYFKSYTNTTLHAIALKQLDFSEQAAELTIPVASQQTVINITDQYKKMTYSPEASASPPL